MRHLIIIVTVLLLMGCTSANDARRALSGAGYTNIKTGGYAWFSCAEDDMRHTKFTATNPRGKRVSGVVCSGLIFKGATIRF